MSLRQRTLTAAGLLGAWFIVVQYAPNWAFFLLGPAFMVAALLELFGLAGRNGLHPQKTLGVGLALLVGLTFYFRSIPLEAALFGGLLAAGVYFVTAVNTAEKLAFFPASFAVTLLALAGAVLARYLLLPEIPLGLAALTGVVIHAAAQVSDPLESLFKRAVGAKDSSND